jgi:hypothetical protein
LYRYENINVNIINITDICIRQEKNVLRQGLYDEKVSGKKKIGDVETGFFFPCKRIISDIELKYAEKADVHFVE